MWKREEETHAAKVLIQKLDISVDNLQSDELIVLILDATAEVQAGVSAKAQQHDSTILNCPWGREEEKKESTILNHQLRQ